MQGQKKACVSEQHIRMLLLSLAAVFGVAQVGEVFFLVFFVCFIFF